MLLIARDPSSREHDPGRGHPERPARLDAVDRGIELAADATELSSVAVRPATRAELERVHPAAHLDRLEAIAAGGGGRIDGDTSMSAGSWSAALHAAGAGLAAVEALERGEGAAAFCAVRPPGHHACPNVAMGFCLINNVAVTAAALAERGERVLVLDWDAHHGNGTQDTFYPDPRVLYVSFHEWPLYPGTGRLGEMGTGSGTGATCNVPLPAGATGDLYLRAVDDVVAPIVEGFDPTWVLVSAGFDAHRADPLTGLGLSAGDFAVLGERVRELAPGPGRLVAFLEGGYDLDALAASVAATLPALAGDTALPVERTTSGGPGVEVVEAATQIWSDRR